MAPSAGAARGRRDHRVEAGAGAGPIGRATAAARGHGEPDFLRAAAAAVHPEKRRVRQGDSAAAPRGMRAAAAAVPRLAEAAAVEGRLRARQERHRRPFPSPLPP